MLKNNPKRDIDSKVPPWLDIELNTNCNLRCKKCFQNFNTPKEELMNIELVERIINEFAKKGGKSLKLIYRGEPLLYPLLPEVIKFAKDLGIPRVCINSNGTLLDGDMSKMLIKAGLDEISISCDACTESTYRILHGLDKFNVVKNVVALQLLKKLCYSETPKVVIHAVRQEENKREIDEGIYEAFWSRLSDDIYITEFTPLDDNTEDNTICKSFVCNQLFERMVVLVDGRVIPCCAGYDYVKKEPFISLGNMNKKSLESCWERGQVFRDLHKQGESHNIEMCRACRGRKQYLKGLSK